MDTRSQRLFLLCMHFPIHFYILTKTETNLNSFQRYPDEVVASGKFENHKVYYHYVGQPQKHDILVYDHPDDRESRFTVEVSKDGNYLIVYPSLNSLNCGVLIADLMATGKIENKIPFETVIKSKARYDVSKILYFSLVIYA